MRNRHLLLSSVLLALTVAACGSETAAPGGGPAAEGSSAAPEPPALTGADVHWGYSGEVRPARWGGLAADFTACGSGDELSPIDLRTGRAAGGEDLELDYGDIDEHLVDNGHSVQVVNDDEDEDVDDQLEVGGVDHRLDQLHFHAPSEHTVDGRRSPVEFHFVHVAEDGSLAVVAALAAVSGSDDPDWQPFVDAVGDLEAAGTGEGLADELDVAALLPRSTEHWAYEGSLTTPPCSEGVHWMVLDHPVTLGADQVAVLQEAYADNNRPVQPVAGREVDLLAR
ncbi:carbonic anhydrase [Nocardioides sp. AX2bis]|uniref:carbonic anhydrase n=1 Tax=Nocardioides sp. AX2bis TaxID=2653157 RepID=UPI0012F38F4C|nr:carbonic anhydrase family protein [Nocardioides sp. AX2bis]VXC30858.1 Carbonic anhydrase [Nocardioides sp. AX2bis]